MKYFVAGGAVRDMLLGYSPKDADYVFDAAEETFIQINPEARKIQSEAHPIFLLRGQEFSPLRKNMLLEKAIHLDLLRRDFTINAMLLSQEGQPRQTPIRKNAKNSGSYKISRSEKFSPFDAPLSLPRT